LREIGLLDEHDLGATFADIAALAVGCQFADCTHQVEPGCAVLSAVASGALAPERHQDYLKLCRELDYQASRDSVQGQQERKRKGKELAKRIKDYYKHP
jgi:ribosome biogenesis GTPase